MRPCRLQSRTCTEPASTGSYLAHLAAADRDQPIEAAASTGQHGHLNAGEPCELVEAARTGLGRQVAEEMMHILPRSVLGRRSVGERGHRRWGREAGSHRTGWLIGTRAQCQDVRITPSHVYHSRTLVYSRKTPLPVRNTPKTSRVHVSPRLPSRPRLASRYVLQYRYVSLRIATALCLATYRYVSLQPMSRYVSLRMLRDRR